MLNKRVFVLLTGLFLCSPRMHSETNLTKTIQFGAIVSKAIIGLWTDSVDPVEVKTARIAVLMKALGQAANGLEKCLCPARNFGSSLLHVNSSAWQCARDIEEFVALQKLKNRYGDVVPEELLKRYYTIESPAQNQFFDWKKDLKAFVRVIDFIISLALISKPCNSHLAGQYWLLVGQNICDLLIRYLPSNKKFKGEGWLRNGEMVAMALPALYDLMPKTPGSSSRSSNPSPVPPNPQAGVSSPVSPPVNPQPGSSNSPSGQPNLLRQNPNQQNLLPSPIDRCLESPDSSSRLSNPSPVSPNPRAGVSSPVSPPVNPQSGSSNSPSGQPNLLRQNPNQPNLLPSPTDKCPVCHEEYSSKLSMARKMHKCGHWFCNDCFLEENEESFEERAPSYGDGKPRMECPCCMHIGSDYELFQLPNVVIKEEPPAHDGKRLFECPVCLDGKEAGENYAFPCAHTCCRVCHDKLDKVRTEDPRGRFLGIRALCPTCRLPDHPDV